MEWSLNTARCGRKQLIPRMSRTRARVMVLQVGHWLAHIWPWFSLPRALQWVNCVCSLPPIKGNRQDLEAMGLNTWAEQSLRTSTELERPKETISRSQPLLRCQTGQKTNPSTRSCYNFYIKPAVSQSCLPTLRGKQRPSKWNKVHCFVTTWILGYRLGKCILFHGRDSLNWALASDQSTLSKIRIWMFLSGSKYCANSCFCNPAQASVGN